MWIISTVGCLFAILVLLQLSVSVHSKKTAKEWAEFNKKVAEIEKAEREEMTKSLGNDLPNEKPGMVFATFGPGFTKEEKDFFATQYSIQLQSAGVKISIFETGKDQWVLTTLREADLDDVVTFLREQDQVMKTTLNSQDFWNLPKYQKEYEAEMIDRQNRAPPNMPKPPIKTISDAERKKLEAELRAKIKADQEAAKEVEAAAEEFNIDDLDRKEL